MNSAKPPRLAAWILQHFGPEFNNEALAGDLWEAFQQGRSKAWYWRQVLAAVRWRRLLYALLGSAFVGWLVTSPTLGHSFFLSRSIDMAVITVVYCASFFVPGMMRGRLRALVVVLIAAIFGLVWRYRPDLAYHYWMLFWLDRRQFCGLSERVRTSAVSFDMARIVVGRSRRRERAHDRKAGTINKGRD